MYFCQQWADNYQGAYFYLSGMDIEDYAGLGWIIHLATRARRVDKGLWGIPIRALVCLLVYANAGCAHCPGMRHILPWVRVTGSAHNEERLALA